MGDVITDPNPRVRIEETDNNSAIFGKTCCNTCGPFDCIERRLRHLFAAWGRIVARHPWPLFLLPIFITMGLSVGFFFITIETSQEKLYTPMNGQAKSERKTVENLFSSVSWEAHTTPARLTELARYVQVIFTKNDDETVLTTDLLEKASDVHQMVLNHVTSFKGATYEYEDLCVMWHGSCLANNVLSLYKNNPNYFIDSNITYPYVLLPDDNVGFLGSELGGVELFNEDEFEPEFSPVRSAQAFRLLYYLKSEGNFDEINTEFESFVMNGVREMSADWDDVSAIPFAARTSDDEVKAATLESCVLFPIASTLLLIFTVRNYCVFNRVNLSQDHCIGLAMADNARY